MTVMAIDLLFGEAAEAQRVIREFKPGMTIKGYLSFLQKIKQT
jgi:hypothetical protein